MYERRAELPRALAVLWPEIEAQLLAGPAARLARVKATYEPTISSAPTRTSHRRQRCCDRMLLPRGGGSEWDRIGRRARRAEFAPVGVHDDSRWNRNRGNAPSSPAAGLNGCRRRSAAGAACIGDLGETAMGVFGRFGSAAFVGILVDRRTRAGVWRRRRRDLAPSHLRPQYKCEA
jgi:hypothetical protein